MQLVEVGAADREGYAGRHHNALAADAQRSDAAERLLLGNGRKRLDERGYICGLLGAGNADEHPFTGEDPVIQLLQLGAERVAGFGEAGLLALDPLIEGVAAEMLVDRAGRGQIGVHAGNAVVMAGHGEGLLAAHLLLTQQIEDQLAVGEAGALENFAGQTDGVAGLGFQHAAGADQIGRAAVGNADA